MTPGDKELLFKDLCARLPYGVKVEYKGEEYDVFGIAHGRLVLCKPFMSYTLNEHPLVEEVKPYLFPLSSMTKEQKKEYEDALTYHDYVEGGWTIAKSFDNEYIIPYWFVDFCNKNHIDYRGLIPKGLANDATGLNIY